MRADAKSSGFRTIPSAAGTISRLVCARLREAGRELEPILRQAGMTIEQVDDPGRRVEIGAQNKLLEIAAKELDDDFLGFNLARSFELREIGVPYYVMASSPRLV